MFSVASSVGFWQEKFEYNSYLIYFLLIIIIIFYQPIAFTSLLQQTLKQNNFSQLLQC